MSGKQAVLAPHHPSCPGLKAIVALEKRGICGSCGKKKETSFRFDQKQQLLYESACCRKCRRFGESVRSVEGLTPAELSKFGLRITA